MATSGDTLKSVRQTHPRLYLGVVGYGLWGIVLGLAMIFTSSSIPYNFPPVLVGVLYIAFGILKIIGAERLKHYALAQIGMNLCISLTILIGIGLLLQYLGGDRTHDLWMIIAFIFAGGFIQVAPAQEPPYNPVTRARDRMDE